MKLITIAMFAALATACAHNPPPQTAAVNTNSPEWQPPTDFEWSWEDKGHHRAAATPEPTQTADQEQKQYADSVARINAQIADEKLQLLMVEETHGKNSNYYRQVVKKFCVESTLLDSRTGHHDKDYCPSAVSASPAVPTHDALK